MTTPLFTGRVLPGGLLVLDKPKDYGRNLRALAGQYVEVIVRRRRAKRSNPQNKWLWGCALEMLVTEFGYDKHERVAAKEQLHYELIRVCFGMHFDERLKIEVPLVRSSKMSTAEFSEYMKWLVRYGAEHYGVIIPLPNEVDLNAIPEPQDEYRYAGHQ